MVNLLLIYNGSIRILKSSGVENAAFEVLHIIKKHIEIDKYEMAFAEKEIDDTTAKAIYDDIDRRVKNEPLQYILGEWEFMSLPFKVRKGVLIPRPETEILVDTALKLIKGREENTEAFDLCTGSGCIAVSLAKYNKEVSLTAIDSSNEALALANENAELNNVTGRVKTVKGDVLNGYFNYCKENSLDIIVSNPPYVKTGDISSLQKEVSLYEPKLALDGGEDGLMFYRTIIKGWKNSLKTEGFMCFECGEGQAEDIEKLFLENGFVDIKPAEDYNGIIRVVTAKNL